MKKILFPIFILVLLTAGAAGQSYQSLDRINGYNWGSFLGRLLVPPEDDYGCLKFLPADLTLLSRTIKAGTPLLIENYERTEELSLPLLVELVSNETEVNALSDYFSTKETALVFYPKIGRLIIYAGGEPFAGMVVTAGAPYPYQPVLDPLDSAPTEPGNYAVLGFADHYVSGIHYIETLVPYGAWIVKKIGTYFYNQDGVWYRVPKYVEQDLAGNRFEYDYFDVTKGVGGFESGRWGSNRYGRQVMLLTKDGDNPFHQFGFASKQQWAEQTALIKVLALLLTSPPTASFDEVMPILPAATAAPKRPAPLPRDKEKRKKALGLYNYQLKANAASMKRLAWRENLREIWPFLSSLRRELAADFESMGVLSRENQQNIVERWLTERLDFKTVSPPSAAKNVRQLNFASFFDQPESDIVFDRREQAVMERFLRSLPTAETIDLGLSSIKALNNYNLGVLVNEILGDLYKSHGCLHVSPRNSYFLYELLPLNAQIVIHSYARSISEEVLAEVPYLANYLSFREDMPALKERFKDPRDVKVEIYPASGYWLISLKGRPFAKLQVKGGPKDKMYLLQRRDEKGRPVFESHLSYPTTPGSYSAFRKTTDYVSNLYYPTTIVPQGALIEKKKGKWTFADRAGKGRDLPAALAADLSQGAKTYKFYDLAVNASGEVVRARWGDHPFGKYAIITSLDKKIPSPELIHSSGTLIMEERQLIADIIKVLSAPFDELDDCVSYSGNFELYKACYDFIRDPGRGDLIEPYEAANYKLYYGLPLSSAEAALLPADLKVAAKIFVSKEPLSAADKQLLASEGIGQNREKLLGLWNDVYRFVLAIEKYAHHYAVLKANWGSLSEVRQAILVDFNNFVIKDPEVFHRFIQELMVRRDEMKRLTQQDAIDILKGAGL